MNDKKSQFSIMNDIMNDIDNIMNDKPILITWAKLVQKSSGLGWFKYEVNVKMSKEYPKLPAMYNMSIVKKSNSLTIDETHNFDC